MKVCNRCKSENIETLYEDNIDVEQSDDTDWTTVRQAIVPYEYRCNACWFRLWAYSEVEVLEWYRDSKAWVQLDDDEIQKIYDKFYKEIKWFTGLFYFTDEACEPCKNTDKILNSLSTTKVITKDINKEPALAQLMEISETPFICSIKDGQILDGFIGWKDWETQGWIDDLIANLA